MISKFDNEKNILQFQFHLFSFDLPADKAWLIKLKNMLTIFLLLFLSALTCSVSFNTYTLTHLHAYTLTRLHAYSLTHLHTYTLTHIRMRKFYFIRIQKQTNLTGSHTAMHLAKTPSAWQEPV
ncbi:MAG: hypothetical protein LH473_12475 [Chitinophagales bacterium]|nr:hypothetical protein [Chitinophagales bacterium]